MTVLDAPEQALPVLEARGLTKHYAVHGTVAAGRRLLGRGRGRGRAAGPAPGVDAGDDGSLRVTSARPPPAAGQAGRADLGRASAGGQARAGRPAPPDRLRQDGPDGPAGPVRVAEPRGRRALPPQPAVQGARPG